MEGRSQVDCNDPVPLLRRKLFDRGYVLDTGIVDHDVCTAKGVYAFCNQCAAVIGFRHIGADIDHAHAMFFGDCCCKIVILAAVCERIDHNIVARACEGMSNAKAYA